MHKLVAAGILLTLTSPAALADAPQSEKPYGIETHVPWTASRLVGSPEPPPPYRLRRVFPNRIFREPVCLAEEPGTRRLLIMLREGRILAVPMDDPDGEGFEVVYETKRELSAFSFDPNYEENGYVWVFSPATLPPSSDLIGRAKSQVEPAVAPKPVAPEPDGPIVAPQPQISRVSRFETTKERPRKIIPKSELVIIEWPAGGHNGGEAIIGPDGCLYISTGDGTSGSDPDNSGQGVNDLKSVMMRLDISHAEPGKPYAIPQDNPFVNYPGARPEIYAHGFRNPWRMSFDTKTGRLMVGDVGQDLWEMIWHVVPGGNYGWSVQEGTHPFHPYTMAGPGPILPPVIEHHHTECRSITGGYVYYGMKFPELDGVYFYGDYEYGKIWGLRYDGKQVTWHQELADTAHRIPTFAVTSEGDILTLDHISGELLALERAPARDANINFPRTLSETGLFTAVADHELSPGVIPFSVNTPVWSDGATKERFFGLPGTAQITFVESSRDAYTWGFEDGSVTAETISLEMEPGNPASKRRIETRLMLKQENHWLGYTYLWNDDQTDATLVDARGDDLVFQIKDQTQPNGSREQSWHVPSRNECMVCHSRAAGFVLGLNTLQMNKNHDYGGMVDNQLRTLNHLGIFTEPLEKTPAEYGALPDMYDETADLEARARAYLHVSCSVCHVSDGGGNARIILQYHADKDGMQAIGIPPIHGTFGIAGGSIIAAGDPYSSVLYYRLSKLGRGRMPHVGATTPDQRALDIIHDWIAQLGNGSQPGDADPARFLTGADADALRNLISGELSNAESRHAAIDQLLASTRSAFVMARAVEKHLLPDAVRQEVIAAAMQQGQVDVSDLFERFVPPSERLKRLGENINPAEILALQGDVEAGRVAFFSGVASQCKHCHVVRGQGGDIGPDLSEIGKKYPDKALLLETLLEPSKKIEPKFTPYIVVTVEGKIHNGLLAEKTEDAVVLKMLQETKIALVRVPVEDIEVFMPQDKSIMPDKQMGHLTAQQAADLLDFLWSLK